MLKTIRNILLLPYTALNWGFDTFTGKKRPVVAGVLTAGLYGVGASMVFGAGSKGPDGLIEHPSISLSFSEEAEGGIKSKRAFGLGNTKEQAIASAQAQCGSSCETNVTTEPGTKSCVIAWGGDGGHALGTAVLTGNGGQDAKAIQTLKAGRQEFYEDTFRTVCNDKALKPYVAGFLKDGPQRD